MFLKFSIKFEKVKSKYEGQKVSKDEAKVTYSFPSLMRKKKIGSTPEEWEKVKDQKKYLARE